MADNERGSCQTKDEASANRLVQLVLGLMSAEGSDAWNGAKALLRQMAEDDPEAVARLRALAAIRRAGLRNGATEH